MFFFGVAHTDDPFLILNHFQKGNNLQFDAKKGALFGQKTKKNAHHHWQQKF